MKKKIAVLLSGLMFFSITGCSFSNFGGTTKTDEAVVVPKDSLVAIEGQEIVFDNGKIQIPEDYTIGSGNFTNPTDNTPFSLVGIWKTTEEEATTEISTDESEEVQKKVDYKNAIDNDIVFYVMSGEDTTTPDKDLDKGQVKTSLTTYYNYLYKLFNMSHLKMDDLTLNDAEGKNIKDDSGKTSTRISSDGNWYYTTFTCTSGDKLKTTYNTNCYPKTYYGIMMLGANQNPDYSRKYFIIMFSNDSNGQIMEESEYNSLFSQVKSLFKLNGFYTKILLPSEKDPALNCYNGRSYSQFDELMKDTYNYYILNENNNSASEVSSLETDNN